MWHTEKDYPQINADGRSLTVAFANLLQKMGSAHQQKPDELYALLTTDDPVVDWWSVAEYIDDMEIHEVRNDETDWPPTSNAIVKFHRMDEATAGMVDHYCLVADHNARSVVDSLDGIIRPATHYGQLVGWASYVPIQPDPEFDAQEARILDEASHSYVLKDNENIWDAARKVNVKAEELIKLNNIADPRSVKKGFRLQLPVHEVEQHETLHYELLDAPVPMHVSKPSGAKKYTFGNAKKWSDIDVTGRNHPENSNHMIVAIAHVELEKEDVTAAYYMDRVDLGNYKVTGRPQFLTGFSHSHMAEGHVEPTKAPENPELTAAIDVAATALDAAQQAADIKPKSMDVVLESDAPAPIQTVPEYRLTLEPLKDNESAMRYMAGESMNIHEVQRRRPARPLNKGQSVLLTHTFEKDNVLYGLPAGMKDSPFWYCIPMDKMVSEDDLYSWDIPLSERIALRGRLTLQERGVVVLSKVLSQGIRLQASFKNKKGGQ